MSDLVQEVITFHGGANGFLGIAVKKARDGMRPLAPDAARAQAKLRSRWDPGKLGTYEKSMRVLREQGYRFPTDLLAACGVRRLCAVRGDMRAAQIPDLLEEAFLFDMTAAERAGFARARQMRNKAGHGRWAAQPLKKTIDMHAEMRRLATRIDAHVAKHFLVIERA